MNRLNADGGSPPHSKVLICAATFTSIELMTCWWRLATPPGLARDRNIASMVRRLPNDMAAPTLRDWRGSQLADRSCRPQRAAAAPALSGTGEDRNAEQRKEIAENSAEAASALRAWQGSQHPHRDHRHPSRPPRLRQLSGTGKDRNEFGDAGEDTRHQRCASPPWLARIATCDLSGVSVRAHAAGSALRDWPGSPADRPELHR